MIGIKNQNIISVNFYIYKARVCNYRYIHLHMPLVIFVICIITSITIKFKILIIDVLKYTFILIFKSIFEFMRLTLSLTNLMVDLI
jgi:hypothetical protein